MSDQEKKEQEIMNQEMSQDEMDDVAGGRHTYTPKRGCLNGVNSDCLFGHGQKTCITSYGEKYGRPLLNQDGSVNCAATVEDGSWCSSNDACYNDEVVYLGMKDCAKAWK